MLQYINETKLLSAETKYSD